MVVLSKILPLIAAGVGIFFLVNAITRPAHAQQTAGALTSTLGSVGSAGQAIAGLGQGIGSGLAGLFQPVWEVANLFEKFSSLASGSANVSPVAQVTQGNDSATWTVSSGGGAIVNPVGGGGSIPGIINTNPGVTITGGSPGVTGTVT